MASPAARQRGKTWCPTDITQWSTRVNHLSMINQRSPGGIVGITGTLPFAAIHQTLPPIRTPRTIGRQTSTTTHIGSSPHTAASNPIATVAASNTPQTTAITGVETLTTSC